MSEIFLTDEEIKEYDYFDLEVCKAIAQKASEKAQRVTAYQIVDWINNNTKDFPVSGNYVSQVLTEHLNSQGIKREGCQPLKLEFVEETEENAAELQRLYEEQLPSHTEEISEECMLKAHRLRFGKEATND